MNTKDNKRHQETLQRIYTAFATLLHDQELSKLSVTDLCDKAEIERSTFYTNFEGINALAASYCKKVEKQMLAHKTDDFAWIFAYIKDHRDVFETYFKIDICSKGESYQETFFRNGVHGIARLWFEGGCEESPKAMGAIVEREYHKLYG